MDYLDESPERVTWSDEGHAYTPRNEPDRTGHGARCALVTSGRTTTAATTRRGKTDGPKTYPSPTTNTPDGRYQHRAAPRGCPSRSHRCQFYRSASVTLNTYSHLWPNAEDRPRSAIAGLMRAVAGDSADSLRTANAESR
jgi:hypothetical protein